MDLALLVYGLSVLGNLNHALSVLLALSAFSTFTCLFWLFVEYEHRDSLKVWLKRAVITGSIILPIFLLVPNEKVMYTMVGAYAAQKVAEDPKVLQFSGKVLKIIENKLDSYIDEAAKKVTK